jgi:hypothetical protein
MPAPPDLPFPHVTQVFLVERQVRDLSSTPLSNVAILEVTSLNAARGIPTLIAATVAASGESKCFTGSATRSTARTTPKSARNPVPESWPHSATSRSEPSASPAATNIAEATRRATRNMERPFTILEL